MNKAVSIALVTTAMIGGVFFLKKVVSVPQASTATTKEETKSIDRSITLPKQQAANTIAYQKNLTEPNLGIQEGQVAQASEVIETQPGPENASVELIKTKVTGQVLSVTLRYVPNTTTDIDIPLDLVNYIDDDTAKQYGVLKDESGKYLASPIYADDSSKIYVKLYSEGDGGGPVVVWMKFPAPSPQTKSVSINIPGVGPFDGVPLQR
jgi:hypothetical protein